MRKDTEGQRRWTARVVLMAVFAAAAVAASISGMSGGEANAQMLALTPKVLLPFVARAAYSDLATPTVTATSSPTATPTVSPTASPTGGPTAPPDTYDQVHLAWDGDPSTTLAVVWRTHDTGAASTVQYRRAGTAPWTVATGGPRPSGTAGTLHEVTLSGLTPGTAYEYRVQAGGAWSATFAAATAPAPGPATFDTIFFADTGLVGRSDGLASGTQQVINEMVKMKPLVLLAGGDYTYFDSDKRYGTYEKSIDAWFNQVQPAASLAPLMPTYGNHEFELDGGTKPWAQRFPMLPADDSRRYYSFDVGAVHFMSLFAASDKTGVDSGQLAWIDQDIAAAKGRGMRWIIPYFHVVMFGDGDNHDANLLVREDLGPVFERHGVKLVLYAHDQAYERSFPLAGVTRTDYRVTSTSPDCYTEADGTVYVKTSPSGKQSNISGGFSPFKTSPQPGWTAVRDNTKHHFLRLRVSAAGSNGVEAWGIEPNKTTASLTDRFTVTAGECP